MQSYIRPIFLFISLVFIILPLSAQEKNQLIGRWDLKIEKDGVKLPSWLEVRKSGHQTLVGRFVYAFGSARPVAHIKQNSDSFYFTIPAQWEAEKGKMEFKGALKDGIIAGTMVYVDGKTYPWTGTRAPKMKYNANPIWGPPTKLFNKIY